MHTTTNMNLCPDQEILDRVKKVTPKLAERAKEVDENSRFPIENYKDLHEAGLIAIAVSKDWGGAGADPVTYHLAALEIAKACGSTGLTYNMHSTVLTLIEALATEEQKKRYLGDCVENGKLFASVTSEEGTSFRHKVVLSGTWTPVDGGYLLNGSKIFSSIGENADYYFQSAFLEGKTTGSEALLTAVVPKSANGVRIEHVWNAMGMRGTATDTIIFEDTFVPQADVLGGWRPSGRSTSRCSTSVSPRCIWGSRRLPSTGSSTTSIETTLSLRTRPSRTTSRSRAGSLRWAP